MLGSDEEFAVENAFGGTAAQSFFGGEASEIRVVVFLGKMRENEIAGAGVKAFGIGKKFADRMIGKMAGAAEDALLHDPGVGADLQHIEIVIRFENEAIGIAQMDFHECRHVAQVGDDGKLGAVGAEREGDRVGSVMRDGESVDVDITDGEALAGVNGFEALEALAERVGKNLVHRVHGRFGNVERSFPQSEHLREAAAVVGVLVGDEDAVEMAGGLFDGGEASKSFALAESGVNEEAGALGLE